MKKNILIILFLFIGTISYGFESLPILDLRTHPLTEIRKTASKYQIGKIISIKITDNNKNVFSTYSDEQTEFIIECKILFNNNTVNAQRFNWGGGTRSDLLLEINDYVIIEKTNDGTYYINNYLRLHIIIGLIIINVILALIFVRKKIIYLLIIIILSFFLIIYFIIPLIAKGYSPVLLTIFSLTIIFTFVLFSIYGKTKIFLAGFFSIFTNIIIMIILTYIFTYYLKITGFWDGEFQALKYFSDRFNESQIQNIREILIATLIISASGALLDVIINIISAVRELIINNPDMNKKQLKKSAYTIGFDIASTMSNTLIFIFIGTSLISFIYYSLIISPAYPVLNDALFATEILAAIVIIISFFITVKISVFYIIKIFNPNISQI